MKQDFRFLSAEPGHDGTQALFDLVLMEAMLLTLQHKGFLDPVQYRNILQKLHNDQRKTADD